jgi:chromosome segregation ATPase
LKSRNLDASCKFAIDDALAVRAKNQQLQAEVQQLHNEKSIEILPPDYEDNKKQIVALQAKISELQNQLDNPTVEIISADDEEKENLKKQLADLLAKQENLKIDIATSQALNQFLTLASFLHEHKDRLPDVLNAYSESNPLTPQHVNQLFQLADLFKKIFDK